MVTSESANVSDTIILESGDFESEVDYQQVASVRFLYGAAQRLAESGPNWYKEKDMVRCLSGATILGMDGWTAFDSQPFLHVDPAKQLVFWMSANKTDLNSSALGEKPISRNETWACYLNLSEGDSLYYDHQNQYLDNTPPEYYASAIEHTFGIPKPWRHDGAKHLIELAMFM